jgi:hypothetical protein
LFTNQLNVGSSKYPNCVSGYYYDISPSTTGLVATYSVQIKGIANFPTTVYVGKDSIKLYDFPSNITLIELGGF